jgi:RNA polymerase sigma factor (sigma-70 family)
VSGKTSILTSQRFLQSWEGLLNAGRTDSAAAHVYNRYWKRLVGLARNVLRERLRTVDAEDVAQAALLEFCNRVEAGEYRSIAKRSSLWALLAEIARTRAIDFYRYETAKRRGGGAVRGHSAVIDKHDSDIGGFEAFAAEPTEHDASELQECLQELRQRLTSEQWQLCLWKAEGMSNAAIAQRLCCSEEKARLLWKAITKTVKT